ncbi:MAG TPA: DEAD/DEAH box helicase family protein [Verrucomicrobiae bacterium]|nr:DEAD/DEAH box helicase family protein [Verrucomicrobiae bacterium]
MSGSYPTIEAGGLTLNEAQTRHELIDPALLRRGWQPGIDVKVEETAAPVDIIHGKGKRRPKGRTDYVLRHPLAPGGEPIPLAILEAKREKQHAEYGLQQGKGYRVGQLHNVPFVFSTNGHQFVEYNEETGATSEPRPMAEFPTPDELVQRYLATRGLPAPESKVMQLLNTPYKQGRDSLRYYQDAAARAALEKVIRELVAKELPRVLLALGTGAGKTRIAAALLRRIFDAGFMGRGLFLCDRTELRDNGLGDFQAAFGNDAAEVDTKNPQKNARVLIATYQTLDHDNGGEDTAFFLKHYPAGYFDVIVIDECHRSAWGDWHFILENNKQAIQIGLTATPRQIRMPEAKDEETRRKIEADRRLLADNLRYFGEPAYEYTYQQGVADGYLAPADLETYDLYHDQQEQPERVRGVLREDVKDKNLTNALTGQKATPDDVSQRTEGASLEARLFIPERVQTMCAHFFARLLATGDDDPLQKTIIFCASDHHADLVANELNALYARWCRDQKIKRVQTYAFKCMASSDGQALIPEFRGRQRSHIIATTKDLLTTGVNVPCVRNIVFFRYVHSPILFHQMIGRGTRIDEANGKLMFRIFDYTGATTLFGSDFIVPPPPGPGPEGPKPPGPQPPPPIKVKGVEIEVVDTGHFNLMTKDGRLTRVTPQEYQDELIRQLTANVPTLAEFRTRWLDPAQRQELLEQLAAQNLLPEILRDAAKMDAYDEFDVLAALAYRVPPLTREQRAARFGDTGPDWLVKMPPLPAKVIRAIVRQFERAGTGALEAKELWQTPEIRDLKGLETLKQGGQPNELLRKTKETLFAS